MAEQHLCCSPAGTRRYTPLLLGFIVNVAVGMTTYAWSIFIQPLHDEFGWTRAQIALAFSICCLCFGAFSFVAGKLNDRYGPSRVVMAGGVLLGCGFSLAGSIHSLTGLYLTYGLMAGAGAGLAYLPSVALAPKWWPERRALASGIIVLGLGLGSFLMAPLATRIILTPGWGWRCVFRYCGVIMGLMAFCSGAFLRNPPSLAGGERNGTAEGYTHRESIRTSQFWLLYLVYFCCSFSGLMVIGHLAAGGRDAGLTAAQAAAAVSALTLSNASTRVLSGWIADRIGIKGYFIALCGLQVLALPLLHRVAGYPLLFCLTAALVGWNYGALFTLLPATCAQCFGSLAQASNFGLLHTAWGLAGFSGPWIGGWLRDVSGGYSLPFLNASGVAAIAVVALAVSRHPGFGSPPYIDRVNA